MAVFNYPKVDLFGRCMELYYVMGIIPLLPDKRTEPSLGYRIYSFAMFYSGCIFNILEFVNLAQSIINENTSLELIITNYMLASLHSAGLLKSQLGKSKKGAEYLRKIIDFEERVYASRSKKLIDLYKNNSTAFRTIAAGYFTGVFMVIVCYGSSSLFRSQEFLLIGNVSYEIKQLPIPIWSPFNQYTHYLLSYSWSLTIGTQLAFYFVAGDLICFGYSVFALCKLEMLKHFIGDFFNQAKVIQQNLKCDETESYRILQRECIIMHQEIISYIDDLNSQIKYLMLMDFLPGSIQMAALMYQLMNNLNIVQMVLIGEFVLTLTARFFIYCVNANKINEESQLIGTIWYQIDWTVLPNDVKRNIIICITRSQKPLSITVGDFQEISLVTFVSIMKGAYTYMMFLTTF
ncbi:odorant receptor 4-like isoform X1 [Rhynchophorus ferrugineus]|uniref:odorant receptor 4-like isoform X1 n=2 Tax=Rhynchophorus ferrugineus TaxID=354439 RepID=UPI003FCE564A